MKNLVLRAQNLWLRASLRVPENRVTMRWGITILVVLLIAMISMTYAANVAESSLSGAALLAMQAKLQPVGALSLLLLGLIALDMLVSFALVAVRDTLTSRVERAARALLAQV